jgi:hypothetical protein
MLTAPRSLLTVLPCSYVFGTGLVGFLLLQTFVAQQYSWVVWLELVPGWALYRGLYEIAQVCTG